MCSAFLTTVHCLHLPFNGVSDHERTDKELSPSGKKHTPPSPQIYSSNSVTLVYIDWSITLGVPHCSESGATYLSRASRNLFLCTSNWNTVLSQSVEALSLPPCFFRNASNPFSRGYFWLPINTTDPGRGGGGRGEGVRETETVMSNRMLWFGTQPI